MYRLVLEGLFTLSIVSIFFGFAGLISHKGLNLILSLIVILISCHVVNYVFAKMVGAARNVESVFITAFILFFIFAPARNFSELGILALGGAVAMASKYILAVQKKHIFNPAAIGVFILGAFGLGNAIWWVATPYLLPFAAVLGFLILKKIDKFQFFFLFVIAAMVSILGVAFWKGAGQTSLAWQVFLSWPIVFFGTVMLTEPLTAPPGKNLQIFYALIVGSYFGFQFQLGPIFSTPALALIVGNLYAFFISPKYFAKLSLLQKKQLASGIYELIFSSTKKLQNIPGQYMEWTLPHSPSDNRGTRRYFTIASSPTESDIKIGVRVSQEKGSSFKKQLLALKAGDDIIASRLIGDFVLPKDPRQKLAFIAGGIGITPFRSMVRYLIDNGEKRQIILLYGAKTADDFVYKDIFDTAERTIGLKTFYVLNQINEEVVKREVPDYKERVFYISGPTGMVTAFKQILKTMGVAEANIKTDFFPGFA